MFPRTHKQLKSDRFRWASFKGGILRVCVGRANRSQQCKVSQICREWRCKFTSLHEVRFVTLLEMYKVRTATGTTLSPSANLTCLVAAGDVRDRGILGGARDDRRVE
jgi:hypothetical protein